MAIKYYDIDQDPFEDLELTEEDMDRIITAIHSNTVDDITGEEILYVMNLMFEEMACRMQTVEGTLVIQQGTSVTVARLAPTQQDRVQFLGPLPNLGECYGSYSFKSN